MHSQWGCMSCKGSAVIPHGECERAQWCSHSCFKGDKTSPPTFLSPVKTFSSLLAKDFSCFLFISSVEACDLTGLCKQQLQEAAQEGDGEDIVTFCHQPASSLGQLSSSLSLCRAPAFHPKLSRTPEPSGALAEFHQKTPWEIPERQIMLRMDEH